MKGICGKKYMKIFSMMLVFLFVFSWAGFYPLMLSDDTSLVTAEGTMPGDVNGDGKIDVCDAILALRGIVGLSDDNMAARADTNGDGVTDVDDAVFILRRVANSQEIFSLEPKGEIDGASVQTTTMVIKRMIGEVGDEVDVTFSVTDPIDIAGFQVLINYQTDVLEYKKYSNEMRAKDGEVVDTISVNPQYDDGTIAIAWANEVNIHKTGNLFTLTFEVIGSSSDVGVWIEEDDSYTQFVDAGCNCIEVTYEYGRVNKPIWDSGTIKWESVNLATGYRVRLYKKNYDEDEFEVKVSKDVSACSASYDFSQEINKNRKAIYTVTVQALWVDDDGNEFAGERSIFSNEFIPVVSIELNQTDLFLFAGGGTSILVPGIKPEDATNTRIEFRTDNKKVVSVTSIYAGRDIAVITPLAPGDAIITATTLDGGLKETCDVKVIVPPSGVTIKQSEVILTEGGNITLEAEVQPADAKDYPVKWHSDNEKVATVKNGKVTAHKAGMATIMAQTEVFDFNDVCRLIVVKEDWDVDNNTDVKTVEDKDDQGSIEFENAGVKIVFEDSIDSGVITAKRLDKSEEPETSPGGTLSIGQYLNLNRNDEFNIVVELCISIDTSLLIDGMSVNNLKLYRFNERSRKWERVKNQEIDVEKKCIWAEVSEFSIFGIFDEPMFGKVTDRGEEISVSDAILILRKIVGLHSFNDYEEKIADVDGSGKVDVQDAILILRRIVGLIDKFPAEEL